MESLDLFVVPVLTTVSSFFSIIHPLSYFPIRLAELASFSSSSSNEGTKWLSLADMTVDVGVEVGLCLWFMACVVKNQEQVRTQGVGACTFCTRLYGNLWEHVA